MSTNAFIAKKIGPNRYRGIYVHWDGYPSHVGKILQENYTSEKKIDELLNFGNVSSFDKELTPNEDLPHGFYPVEKQKDICLFYGRDRGESDQEAFEGNLFQLKNHFGSHEYFYIWDQGEWSNSARLQDFFK
jgi:hypothetical protein